MPGEGPQAQRAAATASAPRARKRACPAADTHLHGCSLLSGDGRCRRHGSPSAMNARRVRAERPPPSCPTARCLPHGALSARRPNAWCGECVKGWPNLAGRRRRSGGGRAAGERAPPLPQRSSRRLSGPPDAVCLTLGPPRSFHTPVQARVAFLGAEQRSRARWVRGFAMEFSGTLYFKRNERKREGAGLMERRAGSQSRAAHAADLLCP